MYIARWSMTVNNGQKNSLIELLRKWEMDVGQRIGWRAASIRVVAGVIGVSDSHIEFEVRVDSLNDLEAAWSDMRKNPYHAQYLKDMDALLIGASSGWTVHEIVELTQAS